MMKKLLFAIALFISSQICAQPFTTGYTFTTPQGAANNEWYNKGSIGVYGGFNFITNYSDTTSLNAALYLKQTPGIVCQAADSLWKRNATATRWINIMRGGSGGVGTVTNIATGYGLSGGPITTTGTLLWDSASAYLTGLRRKDSAQVGFPNGYLTRSSLPAYYPTLQQVFNTEVGGPLLTKNDTIRTNYHKLLFLGDIYGPNNFDTVAFRDAWVSLERTGLLQRNQPSGYGNYQTLSYGGGIEMMHYGNYKSGCTTCGLNSMVIYFRQNASYPTGGVDTLVGSIGAHIGPADMHFWLGDLTNTFGNRYVTVEHNGVPFVGFYNNPVGNYEQILFGSPSYYGAVTNWEGYRHIVDRKSLLDSLVVPSNFKYTAGTPGSGKVLTSDASGNASWQDGSTYYNSNVGSGYRFAIPNTNNIKTLTATNGLIADSATSNQNGIKWGGSFTGATTITNASGHQVMIQLDENDDPTGFVGINKNGIVGFDNGSAIMTVSSAGLSGSIATSTSNIALSTSSPAGESRVDMGATAILISPLLGNLLIDTLLTFPDTTNWKPMVYRASTGEVKRATYWPTGSGGSGITVGITTITSGTDTRVPFNDAGVYGEDAGMVFNKTSNNLTIGSATVSALTSGRVPFISTGGLFVDASTLTYNGSSEFNNTGTVAGGGSVLYFVKNASSAGRAAFKLGNDANDLAGFFFVNGSGLSDYGGANSVNFLNIQNAPLAFGTSNTTYMMLQGNGYFNLSTRQYIGSISTSPAALLHLAGGTATAGTAPLKLTSGTNLTSAEAGAIEYDATELFQTNSTAVRGNVIVVRLNSSSAGTLTLATTYTHYVFTGTTTAWTLPAVSGTASHIFYIKNRGSGAITLGTAAAANELYTSSAVNTLTINPGEAYMLVSDGSVWNVE